MGSFLQLFAAYFLPLLPGIAASVNQYAAEHPSPVVSVLASVFGVGLAHFAPSPLAKK